MSLTGVLIALQSALRLRWQRFQLPVTDLGGRMLALWVLSVLPGLLLRWQETHLQQGPDHGS